MANIYRIFSKAWEQSLCFSTENLEAMYRYESFGEPIPCPQLNGFYQGKKWLDVQVSTWKQDIMNGLLFLDELYEDPLFPDWWLDKIFS